MPEVSPGSESDLKPCDFVALYFNLFIPFFILLIGVLYLSSGYVEALNKNFYSS